MEKQNERITNPLKRETVSNKNGGRKRRKLLRMLVLVVVCFSILIPLSSCNHYAQQTEGDVNQTENDVQQDEKEVVEEKGEVLQYPNVGDRISRDDKNVHVFSFSENGLARVSYSIYDSYNSYSRYGYINREGIVIIPFQFEDAESFFMDDRAAVKENGLWGIIDSSGQYILEPEYYKIRFSLKKYLGDDGVTYYYSFMAEKNDDFYTYYLDINGNVYEVET